MSQQTQLTTSNESVFSLQLFEHAQRVAMMLSKSNLIPKDYQGNIQNTMIALEMANRIGASPLMVMQNLYIVHGKPGWSSSFIIAALNSSKRFSTLKFRMQGQDMERSCVAYATDLSDNDLLESPTISMNMAKEEGWLDKNGSKWKTMPDLMLRYRAAAFFGRLYAPEILMGMKTSDEIIDIEHNVINEMPPEDITPEQLQALLDEKIALLNKSEFDSAKRIIANKESDSYKKLFDLLTSKTDDENSENKAQ